MSDTIEIRRLEVETHIGVPDEERAAPQKVWISLLLEPAQSFDGLQDRIENTVDYYDISIQLGTLAACKPRHLIETLATDVADFLLQRYPLKQVTVEIEKRILPNADHVAVKLIRKAVTLS